MTVTAIKGLFQVSVQKNTPLGSLLESDGTNYSFTGKYGKGDPALPKSQGIPFYDEIIAATGPATTWHTLAALNVNLGATVDIETAPPEISGVNLPTGAYKTGTYYGGQASLQPRLAGNFGYLLYGALGGYKDLATTLPVGITLPSTFTNPNVHRFSMRPTVDAATPGGSSYVPFMAFRRHIPGKVSATDLGEVGIDCVVQSLTIDVPQVGPVSASINVQGRLPYLPSDGMELWAGEDPNPTEGYETVAMSMTGGVSLPGFLPFRDALNNNRNVPSIGARITFNNNMTDMKEERIIGSYYIDDYAAKRRSVQIEMTYKWEHPEMSRFILNQGRRVSGATEDNEVGEVYNLGDVIDDSIVRMREFDPCLYPTAFRCELKSPCDGQVLVIDVAAVNWRLDGTVPMEGDNMITQKFVGEALLPKHTFADQYLHTSTLAGESDVAPSLANIASNNDAEVEYVKVYLINSTQATEYLTGGISSMAHA